MTAAVPDPEGRCSGTLCWYTLPLAGGLIVAHSKAGTLDVCEGGGQPPLAVAVPGPRFRDQLAEVLICSICPWIGDQGRPRTPAVTVINGHAVCWEHHRAAHLARDHRHAVVLAGGQL